MSVVLGNYAPCLSGFCSRSDVEIVWVRREMPVCRLARRARGRALLETSIDLGAIPAMLRTMGLK
jgi:hypothetical protein